MNKWQTLRLEDCMDAIIDYRGKTPKKINDGIPLITAKIIKGGRIEEPSEFIAPDNYDSWMTRGLPLAGDVVLTTEAPLGEVAQLDGRKVALAQRVITLRGKKGLLDNTFLKYALQTDFVRAQLLGRASGSTVSGIKQSELRLVELPIPPFEQQCFIALTLDSLDRKIELNRQINQTLEHIAQALFKSWFVDFDPVKAKMAAIAAGENQHGITRAAMRAISGKTDAELDKLQSEHPDRYQELQLTAELFPSAMQESTLGEIPDGWMATPLTDIMEINPSRQLKKGAIAPYLDMANVPTNSARIQNVIEREFTSGSKFINGDTLLARITPCLENGKTAFVDFLEKDQVGWGSTEFIVLRPKQFLPNEFAYFLCRHPDFRDFAISHMSGTSGRQRVPNDCFHNYILTVPSHSVAEAFGRLTQNIMARIKALDMESQTLATLREILLPRLLSGELDVSAFPEGRS